MQNRPRSTFTTPQAVSEQLSKADVGGTQSITDEYASYYTLVKSYCYQISRMIENEVQRTFVPYYATKKFYTDDLIQQRQWSAGWNSFRLQFNEDCLAVSEIVYFDTTLTAAQYRLTGGSSVNQYPYEAVLINRTQLAELPFLYTAFDKHVAVTGEWGVQDYENDQYITVDTLAEALDETETAIDVTDGTLFNVYDYIRVGDELMHIESISTNTLTVRRGVNGFTAAEHDSGAVVKRWQVVDDIALLATRMVAYWYQRRNDKGERIQVVDSVALLAQFSAELAAISQRRRRNLFGVT